VSPWRPKRTIANDITVLIYAQFTPYDGQSGGYHFESLRERWLPAVKFRLS